MEILFENRYTMSKERFMDWASNPIRKNHFVIMWLVIMSFTVFLLLNSILNQDIFSSVFSLFFTMFCIYRAFFRSKMMVSKQFKVLVMTQGANEWERVIQFTDYILVIDGVTTTKYKWSQVAELIDSKDYLVLMLNKRVGLRIEKDQFTKGTPDTFLQFVKDQYPSIPLSSKK
jgi:hypothetical protein